MLTAVRLRRLGQLLQKLVQMWEMLRHRPLQKVQQRRAIHALRIHQLIDTAHSKPERATLDTRTVHVVPDQQYQVQKFFEVVRVEEGAARFRELARGIVQEGVLLVEFELVEHVLDSLAEAVDLDELDHEPVGGV